MFFSRWRYSTSFCFPYLSCLWLYVRISAFHPLWPLPLPEVLSGALIVTACASGVPSALLLSMSLVPLVLLPGALNGGRLHCIQSCLSQRHCHCCEGEGECEGKAGVAGASATSGVVQLACASVTGGRESQAPLLLLLGSLWLWVLLQEPGVLCIASSAATELSGQLAQRSVS